MTCLLGQSDNTQSFPQVAGTYTVSQTSTITITENGSTESISSRDTAYSVSVQQTDNQFTWSITDPYSQTTITRTGILQENKLELIPGPIVVFSNNPQLVVNQNSITSSHGWVEEGSIIIFINGKSTGTLSGMPFTITTDSKVVFRGTVSPLETPPALTSISGSTSIHPGKSASLSAFATGEGLAYQWYRGMSGDESQPIESANYNVYATLPLWEDQDYWLRVTNTKGSIDSDTIHITVTTNHGNDLFGMGISNNGQLGCGVSNWESTPSNHGSQVAAAGFHSLFVEQNGKLWAMGKNTYGAMGTGQNQLLEYPQLIDTNVAKAYTGWYHSLYVKTDHTLWAMGYNSRGQLGDGTDDSRLTPVYVTDNVMKAAVGGSHSLILKKDYTLWAMGLGSDGALGTGNSSDQYTPVQVASGVVDIAAGEGHSLYVLQDGSLWTMGKNYYGQLGDGTTTKRMTPVNVANEVSSVSAEGVRSYFIKEDKSLWGMGHNYPGLLGDGTSDDRKSPIHIADEVAGIFPARLCTFFVTSEYDLWAMGESDNYQMGFYTDDVIDTPVKIMSDIVAADGGSGHSLFLNASGRITAFGDNTYYPLGDRPYRGRLTRMHHHIADWDTGDRYSIFLDSDGTAWTTGINSHGQLGLDTAISQSVYPRNIMNDVTQISAGKTTSLFVRADKTLWACGSNASGQFGNNSTEDSATPIQIGTEVIAASAGAAHSLILKDDHSLWSVGSNEFGQLGDGSTDNSTIPIKVSDDVLYAEANANFCVFIKNDGTLWGMGQNNHGQLGSGDFEPVLTPILISEDTSSVSISNDHTLFINSRGTLKGTGSNTMRQISKSAPDEPLSSVITMVSQVEQAFAYSELTLWRDIDQVIWVMGDGYTSSSLPSSKMILSEDDSFINPRLNTHLFISAPDSQDKIVFSDWLLTHFSSEQIQAWNKTPELSDPDKDGISNQIEYLLQTSPNNSASRLSFQSENSNGTPVISMSPYLNDPELEAIFEQSSDLRTWTSFSPIFTEYKDNQVKFMLSEDAPVFIRVKLYPNDQ